MFQSTRPVWGATYRERYFRPGQQFQSTRPVWGATGKNGIECFGRAVSIHAPRVGRDVNLFAPLPVRESFNPRAPCGARLSRLATWQARTLFQSTRPVWGATRHGKIRRRFLHVSIHAPRVGRDYTAPRVVHVADVSIHAPRVGRDDV